MDIELSFCVMSMFKSTHHLLGRPVDHSSTAAAPCRPPNLQPQLQPLTAASPVQMVTKTNAHVLSRRGKHKAEAPCRQMGKAPDTWG